MRPTPAAARYRPKRRAQAAGADQQHLGGLQLLLALHADFGHDQVAAVAQDLFLRKSRLGRAARPGPSRRRCEGTSEIVSPSGGRRGVLAQVADVFVVQIDVDEAAHLAFVVEDLLAQLGILRGQRVQHLAHRGAGTARPHPACR